MAAIPIERATVPTGGGLDEREGEPVEVSDAEWRDGLTALGVDYRAEYAVQDLALKHSTQMYDVRLSAQQLIFEEVCSVAL
jgi:hypothetical protein